VTKSIDLSVDGALFDKKKQYRYLLWRNFKEFEHDNFLSIVMLNPSLADATADDPTIASCRRLAIANGYDGFVVTNLFAYVTPYPQLLRQARDPIGRLWGRKNDFYLQFSQTVSRHTLLAWGNDALFCPERIAQVLANIDPARCLIIDMTARGTPRHPLYVRSGTKLKKAPAILFQLPT